MIEGQGPGDEDRAYGRDAQMKLERSVKRAVLRPVYSITAAVTVSLASVVFVFGTCFLMSGGSSSSVSEAAPCKPNEYYKLDGTGKHWVCLPSPYYEQVPVVEPSDAFNVYGNATLGGTAQDVTTVNGTLTLNGPLCFTSSNDEYGPRCISYESAYTILKVK